MRFLSCWSNQGKIEQYPIEVDSFDLLDAAFEGFRSLGMRFVWIIRED